MPTKVNSPSCAIFFELEFSFTALNCFCLLANI
jgi:hypothetical protein